MTLFQAILGFSIFLLMMGMPLLFATRRIEPILKAFPRNPIAGYALFAAGAGWFIYNVAHLSKADEIGFLSNDVMLIIFAAIALLTIPFVPDFLAVRGSSILYLMMARMLLDAGWLLYSTPQRMLNLAVYIGVVAALIIGASPYKLRDFFNWLFAKKTRPKVLGGIFCLYGLALTVSAFQV